MKMHPTGVGRDVASVPLRGRVSDLSWRERTRLESVLWVTADGRDLLSELEDDRLVHRSSVGRRRILFTSRSWPVSMIFKRK